MERRDSIESSKPEDGKPSRPTVFARGKGQLNPKTGRYECRECGRDYANRGDLYTHISEKHRDKKIECARCVKDGRSHTSFSSKRNLRRHISQIHKGPYRCDICSKDFESKYSKADHLCASAEEEEEQQPTATPPNAAGQPGTKKFVCQICREHKRPKSSFASKDSLKRHIDAMHKGDYACRYCPEIFENKYALADHETVEHSGESNTIKQRLYRKRKHPDPVSGQLFSSKRQLKEHLERAKFKTPYEDYSPDESKCPFCQKKGLSRTEFLDHVISAHEAEIGAGATTDADEDADKDGVELLRKYAAAKQTEEVNSPEQLHQVLGDLIRTNPMDFITERQGAESVYRLEGRLQQRTVEVRLNALGRAAAAFGHPLSLLRSLLIHLLSRFNTSILQPHKSKLQFVVAAKSSLSHPITSPFFQCFEASEKELEGMVDVFMANVGSVFTSRQTLFLDDELVINLTVVGAKKTSPLLFGGGPVRPINTPTDHAYLMRKRDFCCFVPHKTVWENDCALSALHLGILQKDHPENYRRMEEFVQLSASKKLQEGVRYRAAMIEQYFPGIDWTDPQPEPTFEAIQKYLNYLNFQLVVYDGCKLDQPLFRGVPARAIKSQICFIYLTSPGDPVGHLCLITNQERLLNSKFCDGCLRMFPKSSKHKFDICEGYKRVCHICHTSDCCEKNPKKEETDDEVPFCQDCNGLFPSDVCFRMHKRPPPPSDSKKRKQKLPVCDFYIHCPTCGIRVERSTEDPAAVPQHKCLDKVCQRCKEYYSLRDGRPQYCTIQPATPSELGISRQHARFLGLAAPAGDQVRDDSEAPAGTTRFHPTLGNLDQNYANIVGNSGLIFFDLETRTAPTGELIPFACVAFFMCSKCCFRDFFEPDKWQTHYDCCGQRIRRYVGMRQITDFVLDMCYGASRRLRRITCWAFNGSGFDYVFVLGMLVANGRLPKVKMDGRRVRHIQAGKVTFKDLIAYVPTNLASLPKTFQFQDKVLKGFFPHKLSDLVSNNFESEEWPAECFYEPHRKDRKDRSLLRDFLAAKRGQRFVFIDECLKYCQDDVLILALSVLCMERATLAETFFNISFIHSSTFTVAGLASTYYRHLFMKPKSIGRFPVHGYANLSNVQSVSAEIYFTYLNRQRRLTGEEEIRFSKSSIYGEFKLSSLRLDGLTSTEMWEYDSCFHHASKCCYRGKMSQVHPIYKIPYRQVNYLDQVRKMRLRLAHPDKLLRIVNHCQVVELSKDDPDFALFYKKELSSSRTLRHVDVRDSLFGGRVENFARVVELTASEIARGVRIKHVDVVSEYPFVQFSKRFPATLHPTVVQAHELPRDGWNLSLSEAQEHFGVFSVFIVPPAACMFPSVPFRVASSGRTLYGLCASCMRAGEQKLCRHYADEERGWHATLTSPDLEQALRDGFRVLRCYELLDWGAANTTTDLFAGYIRLLIKKKTQTKQDAETIPDHKRQRIIQAWNKIGVDLDTDGWQGNPAIYQFYKILLNSLWGKLAQRQIHRQVKFLKTWKELEDILEDETTNLLSVQPTASDVIICQTEDVGKSSAEEPNFYNPFIASLVASYARLHITSFMGGIGCGSPFYCDTDSLIYKSDPDHSVDPPEDPEKVLGTLTSELPPGTFIKKLVILAPKSYIYDVYSEEEPDAEQPLFTVVKMKGISLRSAVRTTLTTQVLEKLALSTLSDQDQRDFYQQLEKAIEEPVPAPSSTTTLTLPQPRLVRARDAFAVKANPHYAKIISASFNKRLLLRPIVAADIKESDFSSDPQHPSHYPSVPFGYQCEYLGNARR